MNRFRFLTLAFCLPILLFTMSRPAWAVPAFGIDSNGDLYRIDLATGTTTLIGQTDINFDFAVTVPQGLAVSASGSLFATDILGMLYELDPTDASTTLIGDTGLGNIEGLDFLGTTDTLIAADFDSRPPSLFTLDLATGDPTLLVTASEPAVAVRSMTLIDMDTAIIRTDDPEENTLRRLDLSTGALTTIGAVSGFPGLTGLDFGIDGNLYGLTNVGEILAIDPTNANATLIADTGIGWLGLAAVPIPEPNSMALVLAGTAALACIRRFLVRRG